MNGKQSEETISVPEIGESSTDADHLEAGVASTDDDHLKADAASTDDNYLKPDVASTDDNHLKPDVASTDDDHLKAGVATTDDDRLKAGVANENYVHLADEEPDGSKEDQVAARLMEFIAKKRLQDVRTLLQVGYIILIKY